MTLPLRSTHSPGENDAPRVSIILTTLNAARFLREAVDSCLNQTFGDLELIAVDGGSTDGTVEILESYHDPRMRIVHQQNNEGKLPGALNLGLDQARGEYLTWMQADSIYHPQAIEIMAKALDEHTEVGQVYTDFWEIDADGIVKRVIETCEPEFILKAKSDPAGVCFMIRRVVREAVGPHDVRAYPTQDYDYRLRIARQFSSLHICQPLYYWRLHPDSLSGSRPWTIDAKNDVAIRLRLGLIDKEDARKDLAEINIAYAFESYQHGQTRDVPRLVLAGLRRNPAYAANRGVWSILFRSLVR
jgi:glycosyltransferase involved in cell wall biosynthesis